MILAVALFDGCVQPAMLPPPPIDPGDNRSSVVRVHSTTASVTARFERDDAARSTSTCRTPCSIALANGRYAFVAQIARETFGRRALELDDDEIDVTVTPPRVPRLPGLMLTPLGAASMAVGFSGLAVGASLIHPACTPFASCAPSDSSGLVWIGAGVAVFVSGLAMLVTGGALIRESRSRVDVRYGRDSARRMRRENNPSNERRAR